MRLPLLYEGFSTQNVAVFQVSRREVLKLRGRKEPRGVAILEINHELSFPPLRKTFTSRFPPVPQHLSTQNLAPGIKSASTISHQGSNCTFDVKIKQ